MSKPSISIYLDTRRAKAGSRFPVKLRVFVNSGRRTQKLYPLGRDLTEEEFARSYLAAKPRGPHRELKLALLAHEQRALEAAAKAVPFTFDKFERELYRDSRAAGDAVWHYRDCIRRQREAGRVNTASSYELSLKSLLAYAASKSRREPRHLPFEQLTADFLHGYERWMLSRGKSLTTVGIYLRPLRAVFNAAIEAGDVARELYPFGRRRYQIPAGRNVKKALNKEELGKLFRQEARIPEQERARDLWFFSYACNGMNMKDIAHLTYASLQGDRLVFSRAKTLGTAKASHRPIVVPLTDFPLQVIARYGNEDRDPNGYIFPFLSKGMDAEAQDRAVKNLTRFVNQHIKNLAQAAGLGREVSTYWARHSFATNAVRGGASLELIQESLGHSDLKTTLSYWAGFEEETKRGIADKLMDF